jgi:UDP-3-O-[3-hydroxymyristoyl] glucosamine N-acyltransferase
VNGHINITDNVVLTGRAAASNDITKPGIYGGFPLEPHRESVKTLVSLPQIKVLRKQVNKILKHLNLTNEDS